MVVLLMFVLLVGIGFYVSSRGENGLIVSPTIITPSPSTPSPPPSVTNTNSTTTIILNPGAAQGRAPSVEASAATNISSSSARLIGRIDPGSADATYWFEYSEDSLLGSLIGGGETAKTAISTAGTTSVAHTISDLKAGTKYYYRIVGRNGFDTARSDIETFTTMAK